MYITMDSKRLIIFPSSRQISLLCAISLQEDASIYVVLHSKDELHDVPENRIIFVCCDDLAGVSSLRNNDMSVLCCHEEAVFWAGKYKGNGWEFSFDREYFGLLEKHIFKSFAQRHGIPSGRYMLGTEEITKFPVIAKPSIGFGSICVRNIECMSEAENYVQNFDAAVRASAIYSYQAKYFDGRKNIPVFEDVIDGRFYRTPFIAEGMKCKRLFPSLGITKRKKDSTDFNWIEFEYSSEDAVNTAEKIINLHNVLIEAFGLKDGVYISEFILSGSNEPVLLEFSPRQPSSRINRMIYFSEGIDLEQEAILYFFDKEHHRQDKERSHDVRLRLQGSGVSFPELTGYESVHDISEVSVHREKIQCKYFRKLA